MKQAFKSVYFRDHPAEPGQRHIRIAFGDNDGYVFDKVRHLSSEQVRQMLGIDSFNKLGEYAESKALSINRACISLLHDALKPETIRSIPETPAIFDPLMATYRGGDGEELHDWFPYLEGFSPQFVRTALQLYAPSAARMLDPFGGIGTAPLTAASMGIESYYCEINPALQLVCQAKNRALALPSNRRSDLSNQLNDLAFRLYFQLYSHPPDESLRSAYYSVFGDSKFFDSDTFEEVLRLRTIADELAIDSPMSGMFFNVAVIASLVPSSLMIRKGDLRYKTSAELKRKRVSLQSQLTHRLESMARDLSVIQSIDRPALLITEDVQSLAGLPKLGLDCIITSPPYLNGTNYFRNTKLELWFLRMLSSSKDLKFFRHKALTAGINDVTRSKCDKPYPPEVRELVGTMQESAYDSRIPMMVASYFSEFDRLFGAWARHCEPETAIMIDIGDSRYGGVHVPTDRLLSEIAQRHGFMQEASNLLRVRKSLDGSLLEQRLLVYKYDPKSSPYELHSFVGPSSLTLWEEFKVKLPHQTEPFCKRNWGHPLHSLCSYGGKLKPSIAYFLVKAFVPENGSVLDPFAGVGTIPFEACLQGKRAYAFEISPSAYMIANAKMHRPDQEKTSRILSDLNKFIDDGQVLSQEINGAAQINFNRELVSYYHPQTFKEMLLARRYFLSTPKNVESDFVLSCLMHILHGNRPYALSRRSHPITPFAPSGEFEYRPLIEHLSKKVLKSLNVQYPDAYREGSIYFKDATSWWPTEIDSLDAIITSPPFFDSTRFYMSNWIRLWFSGWERVDFDRRPSQFLEMRQRESMSVYESILRQSKERLKPGGVLVMHLGKSRKCNMGQELSGLSKRWFAHLDLFDESVAHCDSHGIRDKGTVIEHQYLVLS